MRHGLMVLALAAAACGSPAPNGGAGAAADTGVGRPAARMSGGMGGMMGGAMGAMMGGARADTSAAPAPSAQQADSAADCPPVGQPLVDAGRTVFSSTGNCFACHGANARGTALAPNLTDGQWLNIDGSYGAIANLVRTGVARPKAHAAPMPPRGGAPLTSAQVCAVSAYVYSISHR